MKKLQFKVKINAPVNKVYDSMLGLNSKSTYEQWTSMFNPTSTYEGSWDKGSKILFVGVDEQGVKGGMVSRIVENIPIRFVSTRHYGVIKDGLEITEAPEVEQWAMMGYEFNKRISYRIGADALRMEPGNCNRRADWFHKFWIAVRNRCCHHLVNDASVITGVRKCRTMFMIPAMKACIIGFPVFVPNVLTNCLNIKTHISYIPMWVSVFLGFLNLQPIFFHLPPGLQLSLCKSWTPSEDYLSLSY